MRLLISIVMIALLFAIAVFAATNLGTTVPVRLLDRVYDGVHIAYVVVLSVLLGAVIVGVFAVFEGATVRLENRRLRREVERLEAELTFVRTHPAAVERREPDEPDALDRPAEPVAG